MKNRTLSDDTKKYNLYIKYLTYKKLTNDGRVTKYDIFIYPEAIDVEEVESALNYIQRKKMQASQNKDKKMSKGAKQDKKDYEKSVQRISIAKTMYGAFYTPDKVNQGVMSDKTFNNIINLGYDNVSDFSIDYDFTKHQFQLTNNPVIFEIQDGMYDYLSKDNNIQKLYDFEDELDAYNEARSYILEKTSSSYSKSQRSERLTNLLLSELSKQKGLLADGKESIDNVILESEKEVSLINRCIELQKDKNYNAPNLYKAYLLLSKGIKNIDNIDIAKAVIRYSKLK